MLGRYRRSLVLAISLAGLIAIIGVSPAGAQTAYTLSGRVVDASNGEALPGANVRIVETNTGAATTVEGRFTLEARLEPGQYRIRVTFVGYESQSRAIELADQQEVTLEPFELEVSTGRFEEIVVTGQAGPTRRKELGNAISSVESADLEEAPTTSTLRSLQGKISGARIQQNSGDPAGGMSIRLRGTSTVLGTADPLFVVDGVVISNESPTSIDLGGAGGAQNRLLDINPNDIARIEVVKGAAAAALYGSRANNGVVQIFTKEGQEGQTEVTYSSRLKTSAVRKTLDVNMAQDDQGQFIDNSGNPLPDDQKRWDYQDFIFDRAYGTEQYLSVSGSSGETRFFTSGSFLSNQGIVDETNFRRYNGTARLQHTVNDWLNVSAGARYAFSDSKDVPNGGVRAFYGALTGFIFSPNMTDPRAEEGEYPGTTFANFWANPLEVQNRFEFGQETNRFIGDFQVDLSPIDNLSVNYILGVDTYEQVGTSYVPPGNTMTGRGPISNGEARRAETSNFQLNSDLNVRYEANVTPDITSTSLVGGTLQYEKDESFRGSSRDLPPLSQGVSTGTQDRAFTDFRGEQSIYGVFGQQSFGINDQFFVTGALRLDGSSVFGEEERWQLYPKLSGSYVVSDHSFWENVFGSVVSNFKLRGSVGWSGGLTSIGPFARFTNYGPQSFDDKPGLQPSSQIGLSDVRPERQREIEIGADVSVLNDRLSVEATYYRQDTEDLLLRRSLAPTTGFNTGLDNVGNMENEGIELRVQGVPVATDNVRWTSTATYTRNRNKVTDIPNFGRDVGNVTLPFSFGLVQARNGSPLGVYFGSAFERNDQGEVVDQNGNPMTEDDDGFWRLKNGSPTADGDGIPAQADTSKVIGNPQPDFTASWINQLQIGDNLSVRFQFDAEIGQDVFNFSRRTGSNPLFGSLEDYERELEGDLPDGYNGAVAGIFENWVEDGSYIKLREVAINYTFQLDGSLVESVKINASGRDLFSIDDYSGYDPEINTNGQQTGVRGFDFMQVPIPRAYSLGVTLDF